MQAIDNAISNGIPIKTKLSAENINPYSNEERMKFRTIFPFYHLVILFGLVLASGCAAARHIVKDADGGIVAIPSNSERNREKAIELMEQHFPGGYVIEREEETVIAQTTHHQVDHGATIEGEAKHTTESSQTRSTATTVPNTEYRIFYRRQ